MAKLAGTCTHLAIWLLLLHVVGSAVAPNFETVNVGLPILDPYSIGCFGDFNSDKHTDVFVISADGTLQVYIYHKGAGQFVALHNTITEDFPITNCIPGDFNYDGKLDVLVQGPSAKGGSQAVIHLGYLTDMSLDGIRLPDTFLGQLMVLDSNNDLLPDFYGMSGDGVRTFWVNTPAKGEITFVGVPHEVADFDRLTMPHGNAFIDLNGDCLPDLFLDAVDSSGQRRFEVWINKKTNQTAGNFQLSVDNTFIIPNGTGLPTFADFDGDGSVDVIFPICNLTDCQNPSLHVLFNLQAPLCTSGNEGYCRPRSHLCLGDSDFKFDITSPAQHITVPLGRYTDQSLTNDDDLPPLMIRPADLNMDGYTDLVIPFTNVSEGTSKLTVWLNVPCDANRCSSAATAAGRRSFDFEANPIMDEYPGAYAATAFDLHDDGTQDLIVLQRNWVNKSGTMEALYSAVALANTRHMDTYFITTMASNGVCESMCPTDKWPQRFPQPKPYGVSQAGVTVKFTVSDLDGVNWMITGAQLSQSAYLSLQLPYTIFGIGRTNDYIEELAVGFPIAASHHARQFQAIIPNSQLAIFPWPPDNDMLWTMELFLSFGDWIVAVITALFVVLLVLGGLILILHLRAQRESQKERSEELLAY